MEVVLPPYSEVVLRVVSCSVVVELLEMEVVSSLEGGSLDGGQETYGDQEGVFVEGAALVGLKAGLMVCLVLGPLLLCLPVQLQVS